MTNRATGALAGEPGESASEAALIAQGAHEQSERSNSLDAFAERLRTLRARQGLTRKALAEAASVSDRYLASLEFGRANPSLLILGQLARALACSLSELLGDVTTSTPEWLLMRELLEGRTEAELRRARIAIGEALGTGGDRRAIGVNRIALVGLRGAGKSTLGHMLAEDLDVPFLELRSEVERMTGYSVREILDLYGAHAYRRYERRALEEIIQIYSDAVIATPGGIVSDPATFNLLLTHCLVIWLKADPGDHMDRVARQGDFRPMNGNPEAMDDLQRILEGRTAFYSKADITVDTSRQTLAETFVLLRREVRRVLRLDS